VNLEGRKGRGGSCVVPHLSQKKEAGEGHQHSCSSGRESREAQEKPTEAKASSHSSSKRSSRGRLTFDSIVRKATERGSPKTIRASFERGRRKNLFRPAKKGPPGGGPGTKIGELKPSQAQKKLAEKGETSPFPDGEKDSTYKKKKKKKEGCLRFFRKKAKGPLPRRSQKPPLKKGKKHKIQSMRAEKKEREDSAFRKSITVHRVQKKKETNRLRT